MVTVRSLLSALEKRFADAGLDTPELDARLLVQEALSVQHADLVLHDNRTVSESEMESLSRMAERRVAHEPVSRILGRRAFWEAEFKLGPGTLDPRPDSETLIEAALDLVPPESARRILDLGTGTGCLLLSLLHEFPESFGLGLDIDPNAVQIATENAAALGLDTRARFMQTDWALFTPETPFTLVVSNPPYIKESDIAALAPEVRTYDPHAALSGGADGLFCYREIIKILPRLLARGGTVIFEIGFDQAASVTELLERAGFSVLQPLTDLAGHDRCLIARWSEGT